MQERAKMDITVKVSKLVQSKFTKLMYKKDIDRLNVCNKYENRLLWESQ